MINGWKSYVPSLIVLVIGIKSSYAQVLTSDDLVRAGVTRLSDLLELADQWVGSSTEGFHWSIAPVGQSWQASPEWNLFIDDQPVNVRGLNQQGLNELPLTITEICEVHLHSRPVVIGGLVASGGAIEIRRCIPKTGFSLEGQFSAGNETGDPGPYKYTDKAVPNVDRTGPTGHGLVAAASENLFLRITVATDEHHVTDPRIRPRVLDLYQGEKDARIQYRAMSVDSQVFNYKLSAAYSRVQDIVFLPMMAREIPLDKGIRYVSVSSDVGRFGYAISGNSIELHARENKQNLPLFYSQGRIYAHVYHLGSWLRNVNFNYGMTAELARLRHGANQMEKRLGSLRIYTLAETNQIHDLQVSAIGSLTLDTGVIGYEVLSDAWHEQSRVGITILLRHRALESKMNVSSWVSRGFDLEGSQMLDLPQGLPNRESVYSADLYWTIGNEMNLRLSGGWSRYVRTISPVTQFSLALTDGRLQSVTNLAATSGNLFQTSARVHVPVSDMFRFKISGVYLYPWSVDDVFMNAWIHRIQFGLHSEFQPNDRFSIDMRLRYVGSSIWKEYEEASKGNPELYAMELPGAVHLNLTVQKRFWKNRLRVNATMRNALNHPHLSHPAGSRTSALFQVGIKYAFHTNRTH